jgi:hypothetical protein
MTSRDGAPDLEWGAGWTPVAAHSGLQAELDRELSGGHPLLSARPVVFGRCRTCDDVVATLAGPGDPGLAVIHLTWSGRPEAVAPDGRAWPYFEPVTLDALVRRFVEGGEHL